ANAFNWRADDCNRSRYADILYGDRNETYKARSWCIASGASIGCGRFLSIAYVRPLWRFMIEDENFWIVLIIAIGTIAGIEFVLRRSGTKCHVQFELCCMLLPGVSWRG